MGSRLNYAAFILLLAGLTPLIYGHLTPNSTLSSPREMREAVTSFLRTLDEDQLEKVQFTFDSDERENWFFVPITGRRKGLSLQHMTAEQRIATDVILQSLLSAQGYLKVSMVRQLERILNEIEHNPAYRNPEYYFFTVFGNPNETTPWGWRWEGHHLSINVTIQGDLITATPTFIGTNPAIVQDGVYAGLTVLADEDELGRALAHSFSEEQWQKALIAEKAPRDIITSNNKRVTLDQFEGISYEELNAQQQNLLQALIKTYTDNLEAEEASKNWARIEEAGMKNLYFAWAGGVNPGEGRYYRIHGPVTLIEYDNTQGNANHAHSVWRDPSNDFGEDLLHNHYQNAPPDHGH